ncbi:hypothetical protein [Streptosporangium pseudovulgare]|uniref:Uncharacterized protein n=1 Tax=Streptosporangium pseudovulgare TaxID=35765 RepID=A0ABQ2QKC6_9ACTN|nr:hypothetical protein [Streptosporangium pseudovulgare]GGP84476.1 hypothetical protein GCM10010140_11980 [Streptosporangium pseudovulgare]
MLTHNDIANLGPDDFAALYETGAIDHLVSDLEVTDRDDDGTVTGVIYNVR